MLQLPNQAPYQLGHTRIDDKLNTFIILKSGEKASPNWENHDDCMNATIGLIFKGHFFKNGLSENFV